MFKWLKSKKPAPSITPKQFKPPSRKQIEDCQLLGVKVNPRASSRELWEVLEKAKRTSPTKEIWGAHCAQHRESEYQEMLEEFTEEFNAEFAQKLVDDYQKWNEDDINYRGCQWIIVYKKGKTVAADVMEIESVELDAVNAVKPYVTISFLRPKKYKGRGDEEPYIEWEKEFSLKPDQILEQHKLNEEIDMWDVARYDRVIEKAQALLLKYN